MSRFVRTEESEKHIIEVYLSGSTEKQTAEIVGCSINTVQRVIVKYGVNIGQGNHTNFRGGGYPPKFTDAQLTEDAPYYTQKQLAEKYGVHVTRVCQRLKRLGIKAKPTGNNSWEVRANRGQFVKEKTNGKFDFVEFLERKQYRIKCKVCGYEFAINTDNFTDGVVCCNACGNKTERTRRKRSPQKRKPSKPSNLDWHWTDTGCEMIKSHQPGFDFVAYKDGRYRVKCRTCGREIERARSTIAYKNIVCDCEKIRLKKQKEIEKLIKVLSFEVEANTPKVCCTCGSVFYSPSAEKKYCSERCKRKSKSKYRSRAKRYGVEYDSTITLEKVRLRDGDVCQLCGKPVDDKDTSWNGSFGALYPTIDHIVAMKNGGGHTWDNVQLAHAVCNSYKRDLIDKEQINIAVLEGIKLMGKEARYAEIQTA